MPDTQTTLWDRYRSYTIHAGGVTLDPSFVDFDDALFTRMAAPMEQAFDEMAALERGAIANADEKRMVGHYWLRAPELAPDSAIRAAIDETLLAMEAFVPKVRSRGLVNLLVVGIGGSALGPQLVADALGNPGDPMRIFFFDNTDPDGMTRVLRQIGDGLARTLVLVISKSGGTPETRNGMLVATQAFAQAGLSFAQHAVAITQDGSQLDQHARKEAWVARFPMWDWIGGRTSELSAVGLLAALLQGFDVRGMLAGAAAMDRATRVRDARKNPAALLALLWHHLGNGRGERAMVVLPYKDRLLLFSRYLQQLVMESLGKELDRSGTPVHQGIAVYGNKGSTDQHAYVQQLRDGRNDFFATFLQVLEDGTCRLQVEPGVTNGDYLRAFLLGTRSALKEKGRPSITLTIPRVDAQSLGSLIALFERTVGLYASLVNVNAYHQPGVEAGKKSAARVLAIQAKVVAHLQAHRGRGLTAPEIADALGLTGETLTVFKILEHLAANAGRGIRSEGAAAPGGFRFQVT
jgi:glucose-6-phosphate isomerase